MLLVVIVHVFSLRKVVGLKIAKVLGYHITLQIQKIVLVLMSVHKVFRVIASSAGIF